MVCRCAHFAGDDIGSHDTFSWWDPQAKIIELRFSSIMEPSPYVGFARFQDDAWLWSWNLWGYIDIDARHATQAMPKALEASRRSRVRALMLLPTP